MMKRNRIVVTASVVACVIGLSAVSSKAAAFTESFSASASGWSILANNSTFNTPNNPNTTVTFNTWSGTGGQSGGYIRGTRSNGNFVFLDAIATSSAGNFTGDLRTKYGESGNADGVTISFSMRRFQLYDNTGAGTDGENYLTQGDGTLLADNLSASYPAVSLYDTTTTAWTLVLSDQPVPSNTAWTQYSVSVKFDWTDEEATAAGWVKSGLPGSFASTMQSIYRVRLRPSAPGSATKLVGVDEVTISSTMVPEPASAWLLGVGSLALLRRRRGWRA